MEKLTLYHFFGDKLNLYGDRGNVIALKKRSEWRGIELEVVEVDDVKSVDYTKVDMFFIGGGPDSLQALCTEQMMAVREEFKAAIEDGVAALTICGGYQFLGNYYELPDGKQLKGLGVLDFHTKSQSNDPKTRCIGNILLESDTFGKVAGFENHGGRTYHDYPVLGNVVKGFGNNGEDQKEGLVYNNLIGTYLHGPILPKNPTVADFLLGRAWERKTGQELPIYSNNELENEAIESIWKKVLSS